MSLVLLSLNSAVAVAGGMVTVKSVAFRFPRRLRLTWFAVPEVVELVPVVVEVPLVVLRLFCKATVALVGGLIPRFRVLSRLTCIMATSTMTSGRALSRSLTNFSASAIWSGVPRTTSAPCEGRGWMREISRIWRSALTTSCNSVGCDRFAR